MKILRSSMGLLACGLLAACQDLTVLDKNRPSLDVSLSTASNLETSVGAATRYWFGGVAMGQSINQRGFDGAGNFMSIMEAYNDNMTYGGRFPTVPATTVMYEPPRSEFDHVSDQFTANKGPFQDAYAAIVGCHDVRASISNGLSGDAFPQSARSAYFCKLVMGFSHLYLGVLFDKGYAVEDDFIRPIDPQKYTTWVPHDSLVEFAKTQIHQGIAEAVAAPFSTTLPNWINGAAYTNIDMAKVAYGYLARAEVWKAVTPAQREDVSKGGVVNWNKVVAYVDSSLTSTWSTPAATAAGYTGAFPIQNSNGMSGPNFTTKGTNQANQFANADLYLLMYASANNFYRMHHKGLGPADTTGAYVTWLKTPIGDRNDTTYASPDKRLPRGPCLTGQSFNQAGTGCLLRHVSTSTNANYVGNALPGDGNYFQLLNAQLALTANSFPGNPWRRASYMMIRFGNTAAARRLGTSTGTGVVWTDFQTMMTPEEQDLLRAEAYMRLGTNIAGAVTIINKTRTNPVKGGLPPVTAAGPTQPYPQCVPHSFRDAEKCGDLWDALLWEKRMEQMGTDGFLNYSDWRSWGLFDTGTPVFWPPSYRETGQIGYPYYTYGGNMPGSVNASQKCGTGTWQSIGCVDYTVPERLPKPPL